MFRFAAVSALAISCVSVVAQQYNESPTDDIWVYAHTGSGQSDPFLRAWGDGTNALDPAGFPPGFLYSYSYLKFDLSAIPVGTYAVTSATLSLVQAAPGYSQAQGEAAPLQARELASNFDEATWNFGNSANPQPGEVLGTGDLSNYNSTADFTISIDLQGPDFDTFFNESIAEGSIAFALTSAINPGGQGGAAFYKVYSIDDPGQRVPVLNIEYSPVPEPSTLLALALGVVAVAAHRRRRK